MFLAVVALAGAPLASQAASVPAPVVERQDGATLITQPDPAAPLVNVTIVVRAGLDRQTLSQNGVAALTAQSFLRMPVDGVALEDAIVAHGGSVHFVVDPSDVRFSVESLAADAPAIMTMVEKVLASPAFTPAVVRDARAILVRKIDQSQQAALQVGIEMLRRVSSGEANIGLPALGIPASLAQLGPDEVKAFYQKNYRRGGSYVSTVGRTDALPAGTLAALAQALPAGSTSAIKEKIPTLTGASRQIVTHRDVSSPWLIAQYSAPSPDSKDFGPMLVLSAFMQRTLADIAQVPGVVSETFASRAVGTLYAFDREPPSLTLYVNGGIANPNRAFATALSVASVLAATKLEGSIDQFKAMALGDFATGSTTLESRAWLAVIFTENGMSGDYLNRTMQAISTTTSDDLQRVARRYLGSPMIALVLPRERPSGT
jgi:zinc protease